MPKVFARRIGLLVLIAATAVATALAPQLASASPDATPKAPTVASVEKQLGRLALANSQLVEQYDHARVVLKNRQAAVVRANNTASAARNALAAASAEMSRTLTAEYEGSAMSVAGALLTSRSDDSYLAQMDTMNIVSAHTAQVVDHMSQMQQSAKSAATAANKLVDEANAQLATLAQTKIKVQKQITKYQVTLGMLTAAQQATYSAAINPTVSSAKVTFLAGHLVASAKAKIAVHFALAQVGKPYVWGAAGPSSYDCSGLTMASWAAAGVSLPHSAADQYNYGTHVSMSQLTPGDLIFMYSPIGHVTIYIGDGMMVSAPQSGEDVSVIPVSSFSGSIVGATHLG